MAFDAQIIILGAGPGGATAAMSLASQGQPVTLIDKANFPRDKICGDAISGKVVDTLRKIDPALAARLAADHKHLPCWGVQFVAPSGEVLSVPFRWNAEEKQQLPHAPGFIARRMDFDDWLLREALQSGPVDFRPGMSIRSIERSGAGFVLKSSGGESLSCRILIAADGAQSLAAKSLSNYSMDAAHHSAAVRAYYRGVSGLHEENFIELHYLRDLVPGYFWIFPLPDGRANVGLGLRSDVISKRRIDLKKVMESIIREHPHFRERFRHAEAEASPRGFGLPLGSRRRKISGDGFLLVGDSASLIDPFTGEGIGNAMISGRLAARRVLEGLQAGVSCDESFLSTYDRQVYHQLGDELRLSHQLQRLASYPRLFNFVVRKANRNPLLRQTISCMFEDLDMREQLRKPSFYMRLLWGQGRQEPALER